MNKKTNKVIPPFLTIIGFSYNDSIGISLGVFSESLVFFEVEAD